ncbi:hypothetical protein K435DRAFT_841293 [Dendrothele bispora CBS 962.96]|uniref:Uncharacterized protein n=1 Tax=Dendrothele bispora (strain CBS 962.96) TaxID=1314807 RepID=A0A4V4HEE9_DENBC|nr:hypothetical protein K435DRAFT_841293 [Dendrothele bispora CBS 962.96]
MIASSLWLGVSFSLFVALVYSSNQKSRRTPLFWFSVVAIGFGTVPSILFLKLLVQSFVKAVGATTEFIKPYIFALSFFSYFSSIFVDSILLLRIVAVFPPARMPRKSVVAVFGPLLIVKLARIGTVIAAVFHFISFSRTVSPEHPQELYPAATKLPEPKAVWSLQLMDNAICSFLFLYKLHKIQSLSLSLGKNTPYIKRLHTLFILAISNFVFPVIFVIVQLIFISRDISYLPIACLNVSGVNIEVIGVLFATIWSAQLRDNWNDGIESSEVTHEIVFGSAPTQSGSTASTSDIENGRSSQTLSVGRTKSVGFQHSDDLGVKAE